MSSTVDGQAVDLRRVRHSRYENSRERLSLAIGVYANLPPTLMPELHVGVSVIVISSQVLRQLAVPLKCSAPPEDLHRRRMQDSIVASAQLLFMVLLAGSVLTLCCK